MMSKNMRLLQRFIRSKIIVAERIDELRRMGVDALD